MKPHISKRHTVRFALTAVLVCIALNVYSRRVIVQNIGFLKDGTEAQRRALQSLNTQIQKCPDCAVHEVQWQAGSQDFSFFFRYEKGVLLFNVLPSGVHRTFSWRFPFVSTQTVFNVSDQWPRRLKCSPRSIEIAAKNNLYLNQMDDLPDAHFIW